MLFGTEIMNSGINNAFGLLKRILKIKFTTKIRRKTLKPFKPPIYMNDMLKGWKNIIKKIGSTFKKDG